MMRAYLAMVLCTVAAAQAEDWTVLRHTDCAPQAATVLWGTPFEQCLKKSDQKSFMYLLRSILLPSPPVCVCVCVCVCVSVCLPLPTCLPVCLAPSLYCRDC